METKTKLKTAYTFNEIDTNADYEMISLKTNLVDLVYRVLSVLTLCKALTTHFFGGFESNGF